MAVPWPINAFELTNSLQTANSLHRWPAWLQSRTLATINGRFPDNHFPGQTFPGQDVSWTCPDSSIISRTRRLPDNCINKSDELLSGNELQNDDELSSDDEV